MSHLLRKGSFIQQSVGESNTIASAYPCRDTCNSIALTHQSAILYYQYIQAYLGQNPLLFITFSACQKTVLKTLFNLVSQHAMTCFILYYLLIHETPHARINNYLAFRKKEH